MNEGYAMTGAQAGYAADSSPKQQFSMASRNTTVAQNIDNRISALNEQIQRLEAVKAKLSTGTILDVSLDDLQMAMGRY